VSAKILPIMQVGEPVLRERARTLSLKEIQSREIRDLIRDMRETMYKAPGVGLAAPQVGLPLQLAVLEDKAEYQKDVPAEVLRERERRPVPFQVIINPKLTPLEPGHIEFYEGCLSLNGFTGVVRRARAVRVECLDEQGAPKVIEASGWHARILQHEIDHLRGTIYIDRMLPRTFMSVELFNRQWKDKGLAEIRQLLDAERAPE
jgi:peptide deformylase